MKLLKKELVITGKSLTFWLIAITIGGFLLSQLPSRPLTEPKPNQEDYGVVKTTDKNEIMKQTLGTLYLQHEDNQYTTYPFGFLKLVKLSKADQNQIKLIMEKAAEQSYDELQVKSAVNNADDMPVGIKVAFPVSQSYTYQMFQKDMEKVTGLVGGGSDFAEADYLNSTKVARNYEEALAEFDLVKKKDQVVGAYARIICDYLGIILSLVPAFLAATVVLRDRRSRGQETIFTKKTTTLKLMGMRFLSVVLLTMAVAFIVAIMPSAQALFVANKLGVSGNPLTIYLYLILWLVPSVLAVCGMAFLVTTLFGGIAAVVTAFVTWFAALNFGVSQVDSYAGWNLIPRFNQVGGRSEFEALLPQLITNRIFWSLLGIGFFLLSVVVMDLRRKGVWRFGQGA